MALERGEVSVGDAIRALRALNLPRSALPEVAEMLGFAPTRAPAVATTAVAPAPEPPAPVPFTPGPGPREPTPPPQPAPEPPLPETPAAARRPTQLIPHPPLAGASLPPRKVLRLADLIEPAPDRPRRPDGLFAPELERAIAGALVASRRPDGDPDIEALVARIAAGEAITTIPRLPLRTTRLGVRLLVDAGPGMLPFRRDAQRLAAQIAQLVGAAGVERLDFDRSPLGPHGLGTGAVWKWKPYHALRPLAAGRPVLALTDLGLGGRAGGAYPVVRDWLAFAELVAAAGSRLVLLVPYPRSRWPAARGLHVVRWDRTTSVREALA